MSDLLKDLNPQQREAVLHSDSPLLILAGAGSGKTKVLTHRIANFVQNHKINSYRILGVTFTNKAAREMRERINKVNGNQMDFPFLGTFHGICVKILKTDGKNIGLEPSFTIYDSDDQKDLVKEALKALNLDPKELSPNALHWAISQAKNELIDSKSYGNLVGDFFTEQVARVYPLYQQYLEERNAVDFDDLIMKTLILLQKNETIRNKYIDKFDQILVDEYQDTNKAQYNLIKILAKPKQNISVVGDEDQSIYGWRGADIQNILSFEKDFPQTKIVKLEQNYRSTQLILDASHSIIHRNTERRDKKLWSQIKEGPRITVYEAQSEIDEANYVITKIQEIVTRKIAAPEEIAVLYRANAQSRALEEQFLRARISYRLVGGMRFYERKEIKDAIAYLRILYNPADILSLTRTINTPPRGIGPKAISEIIDAAKELKVTPVTLIKKIALSPEIQKKKAKVVAQSSNAFDDLFNFDSVEEEADEEEIGHGGNEVEIPEEIRLKYRIFSNSSIRTFGQKILETEKNMYKFPLSNFIKKVLEDFDYIKHIDERTAESESRLENLNEFIGVSQKYDNMDTKAALGQYLEDIALIEDIQSNLEERNKSVTLMTIHASKGLEYKVVFVVGLEEGIFPHSRSIGDNKEIEEERRLAYVAVTRAKEYLFLTYAVSRQYFGSHQSNVVSRFITDIPEHLIDFTSAVRFTNDFGNSNAYHSSDQDYEGSESQDQSIYIEIGDKVFHEKFGEGVVKDIENDRVIIDFELRGRTELISAFARLKKI